MPVELEADTGEAAGETEEEEEEANAQLPHSDDTDETDDYSDVSSLNLPPPKVIKFRFPAE